MPDITHTDRSGHEDRASRWIIGALVTLQCTFLAGCLILL